MSTLDILIALLLTGGLLHGFMTGVVKQVASVVSIIAALLIGLQFMHPLGELVTRWTGVSEGLAPLLGFVTVFGIIHVGVIIVVKLTETVIGALKLGFVNRILGSAFGLFKAGIALSVAFLALGTAGFPGEETQQESVLYSVVEPLLPQSWEVLREYFPEVDGLKEKFSGRFEADSTRIIEELSN